MAQIFEKNAKKKHFFNTGPNGDPPLKIKISKIGLRSDLSWHKLGLEPKCHLMTLGGFGKRAQTHTPHTYSLYSKDKIHFLRKGSVLWLLVVVCRCRCPAMDHDLPPAACSHYIYIQQQCD